ncbi:hypothetical protein ACIRFH_26445 [Streptomyces sp. NPDC093586]|uniref:hypothetical protein n=1 Tax=Streptomyces sp. NPDC093586 TaxID=3366042 RepID=UPI0038228CDD
MEQRIGSSSRPLPGEPVVKGAGFDPAFVPGLTPPPSDQPEDATPAEDASVSPAEETASEGTEAVSETASEVAEEPEAAPDGPVFEAADRRARIVADHRGVRLALDDQACEFRWDEIGAVETETARFGKRYTVTVHTPDRRWYPIEIEAPSRSRFKEWDAALDEVLDAYFDDEADAETDGEPESGAASGAKPESEAASGAKPKSEAASDAKDDADAGEREAAATAE